MNVSRVNKCAKSNLAEVWATLEGEPSSEASERALHDKIGSLSFNIEKKFFRKKRIPFKTTSRLLVPIGTGDKRKFEPFWDREISWEKSQGNRKVLRLGNHFLAFHTLHDISDKPYKSYKSDLEKDIIDVSRIIDENNLFKVRRVVFRYVNMFFIPKSENLGHYFDLNCSVKINGDQIPVSGITAQFNFKGKEESTKLSLNFRAQLLDDQILTPVETTGIRTFQNNDFYDLNEEELLTEIESLKEETKSAFFGCTTAAAKDMLEVKYDG